MGTNYYARPQSCPKPCAHCAPVEVHICKSLTMFQGYRRGPFGDPDPILSWRDWRDALRMEPVDVFDEYGRQMPTEEFISRVEATDKDARRRQYDWVVSHERDTSHDWLDGQGFSFTDSEFS